MRFNCRVLSKRRCKFVVVVSNTNMSPVTQPRCSLDFWWFGCNSGLSSWSPLDCIPVGCNAESSWKIDIGPPSSTSPSPPHFPHPPRESVLFRETMGEAPSEARGESSYMHWELEQFWDPFEYGKTPSSLNRHWDLEKFWTLTYILYTGSGTSKNAKLFFHRKAVGEALSTARCKSSYMLRDLKNSELLWDLEKFRAFSPNNIKSGTSNNSKFPSPINSGCRQRTEWSEVRVVMFYFHIIQIRNLHKLRKI